MIKIGLDIATNTGICVIDVDSNNNLKKILFLETRQLYFKNSWTQTCNAISTLIFEIGEQLQISDEVCFYLEYSNYGNYTSGMFGIMVGMFEMLIWQNFHFSKLKLIDPNRWHRVLFPNAEKDADFKLLSKLKANQYLPYQINDDNQSDAFCLAYFGDIFPSNQEWHDWKSKKEAKEKSNKEKLERLYKSFRDWTLKKESAINTYNLISNKTNARRIEECNNKLAIIDSKINQLKQEMKGGVK